jgi:uncharacterized protein
VTEKHDILWHCASLASSEHASLFEMGNRYRLRGLAVLPLESEPCHVSYDVLCGQDWMPISCTLTVALPSAERTIELSRDTAGRWDHNGVTAPNLSNCSDIDLGWTPATNVIPVRRLDLDVGETASILAAWVRFPEMDVIANEQHYTRVAADRWRYRSGDYDFELLVDASSGLVLQYGDDLWRAVARS